MNLKFKTYLLFILLIIPAFVKSDIVILAHGYLSGGDSWQQSGITSQLEKSGWLYNGRIFASQKSILIPPTRYSESGNRVFTTELPYEAPLNIQASYLIRYIESIKYQFPSQNIILVGHSAGGVVARLAMVKRPDLGITSLISIASPQMGTELAQFGTLINKIPLNEYVPIWKNNPITRSESLYNDLLPESNGTFLYWLNHQNHPSADYFSIVRQPYTDLFISQYSQKLTNVDRLKNVAYNIQSGIGHKLSIEDASVILKILKKRYLIKRAT